MNPNLKTRKLWSVIAAMCAAGTLFGMSCSAEQVEALVVGVGAAADQLEGQNDSVSFGDWVSSQLADL